MSVHPDKSLDLGYHRTELAFLTKLFYTELYPPPPIVSEAETTSQSLMYIQRIFTFQFKGKDRINIKSSTNSILEY